MEQFVTVSGTIKTHLSSVLNLDSHNLVSLHLLGLNSF